jgi:hypothetical protein
MVIDLAFLQLVAYLLLAFLQQVAYLLQAYLAVLAYHLNSSYPWRFAMPMDSSFISSFLGC